jgi:hypothetical protein
MGRKRTQRHEWVGVSARIPVNLKRKMDLSRWKQTDAIRVGLLRLLDAGAADDDQPIHVGWMMQLRDLMEDFLYLDTAPWYKRRAFLTSTIKDKKMRVRLEQLKDMLEVLDDEM